MFTCDVVLTKHWLIIGCIRVLSTPVSRQAVNMAMSQRALSGMHRKVGAHTSLHNSVWLVLFLSCLETYLEWSVRKVT